MHYIASSNVQSTRECLILFLIASTIITANYFYPLINLILLISSITLLQVLFCYYFWSSNYDIHYKCTSLWLGFVFGYATSSFIHAVLTFQVSALQFSLYILLLSFFHFSEFVSVGFFNPTQLTFDSFLLNHSIEYGAALVISLSEYFIECYFFPALKYNIYLIIIGFIISSGGEFFRKAAMYTAKTNFNHIISTQRISKHVLVKHGVYSICRHPSYVGWFYWSIGTQILLSNPICFIGYTAAAWKFMQERIEYEEFHLLQFFGSDYQNYMSKVGTGIPFIKGLRLLDNKKAN